MIIKIIISVLVSLSLTLVTLVQFKKDNATWIANVIVNELNDTLYNFIFFNAISMCLSLLIFVMFLAVCYAFFTFIGDTK